MPSAQLYIVFAFVLGTNIFAKAQSTTEVEPLQLIEDKQPKRWHMYVQNNTDEKQEAFLMIQGTGFRRSASRPVIKKIPARKKVLMMTLIPLKGVVPEYTKVFTYDSNLQTISKRKGATLEDYVNIRPLKKEELTVFIEEGCDKCDILMQFLNENHLKYRVLHLKTNQKVKDFMFDHLRKSTYTGGMIDLPVIMYEGRKHWSINNIQKFIEDYDWAGLKKG